MVAVLSMMVFGGAFAASVAIIASSIAPQWRRILSLAAGNPEPSFAPFEMLVTAEQRITVRRWAATPAPAPIRLRAVA
jgi:hypothetical protein